MKLNYLNKLSTYLTRRLKVKCGATQTWQDTKYSSDKSVNNNPENAPVVQLSKYKNEKLLEPYLDLIEP